MPYRQHRIALMAKDDLHIEMLSHMELDTLFRPEVERTVRNGWLDILRDGISGIGIGIDLMAGAAIQGAALISEALS